MFSFHLKDFTAVYGASWRPPGWNFSYPGSSQEVRRGREENAP